MGSAERKILAFFGGSSLFCQKSRDWRVRVLYRFTVLLLSSGGSDSPWSEFWSEFPHFMGRGVVPAPSTYPLPKGTLSY